MRPPPCESTSGLAPPSAAAAPEAERGLVAVLISAVRISAGLQSGWAWRTSAAAPAVSGLAKLVPLAAMYRVALCIEVTGTPSGVVAERTATPGADTSGLTWPLPSTGPRELKPAIPGAKELGSSGLMRSTYRETPSGSNPSWSRRRRPFWREMVKTGTAAGASTPSSSPGTLLKATTAMAPLAVHCAALLANRPEPWSAAVTVLPRSTRQMLPATVAGTWSGVSAKPAKT